MSERQIRKLLEQREKLNTRIRRKRSRLREAERKRDTRRKILVGAMVMAKWEEGAVPDQWLNALDGYLSRPRDRELFGLPPKAASGDSGS